MSIGEASFAPPIADPVQIRLTVYLADTLRQHRSHGAAHRVRTSRFERGVDTAPNRCLKYALWYLARRLQEIQPRKGQQRILSELNQADHLFDAVTLDVSRAFLSDPLLTDPDALPTIRSYYRDALQLAKTIIEHRGVMLRGEGSEIRMASWVISMEKIFETYLRTVLRTNLIDLAPTVRVLDGNNSPPLGGSKTLFDEGASNRATPDIVVQLDQEVNETPQCPLIMDAKYKKAKTPERDDIEQVIVYATSYRSPVAIIAIPWSDGSAPGIQLIGSIDQIMLYQYAIDLAADNPLHEEESFAKVTRQLIVKSSQFMESPFCLVRSSAP